MLPQNCVSILERPDEYTIVARTARGSKEFQFDQVFTEEHSQAHIFEDTKVCNKFQQLCSHICGYIYSIYPFYY